MPDVIIQPEMIQRTLEFVRSMADSRNSELSLISLVFAVSCCEWDVDFESAANGFKQALELVMEEVARGGTLQ